MHELILIELGGDRHWWEDRPHWRGECKCGNWWAEATYKSTVENMYSDHVDPSFSRRSPW